MRSEWITGYLGYFKIRKLEHKLHFNKNKYVSSTLYDIIQHLLAISSTQSENFADFLGGRGPGMAF